MGQQSEDTTPQGPAQGDGASVTDRRNRALGEWRQALREQRALLAQSRIALRDLPNQIAEVVARELRSGLLLAEPSPEPPPPSDLPAQRTLLCALVEGRVGLCELHPLQRQHLYGPIHQAICAACDAVARAGQTPSLELVRRALADERVAGTRVEDELEQIEWSPVYRLNELRRHVVPQVVGLWQRREILSRMDYLTAQLRVGAIELSGFCTAVEAETAGCRVLLGDLEGLQ